MFFMQFKDGGFYLRQNDGLKIIENLIHLDFRLIFFRMILMISNNFINMLKRTQNSLQLHAVLHLENCID